MKNKTAILLAGSPDAIDFERFSGLVTGDEFVIAADSGAQLCKKLHLKPDIIIGDFDSFSVENAKKTDSEIITLPTEKNDTDTMAAARFLMDHAFEEVLMFGASGGRGDHAFANYAVMKFFSDNNIMCRNLSNNEESLLLCEKTKYSFEKKEWRFFSLLAYGGTVTGVNILGAKYPLCDAVLTTNFPLAVSNEFKDNVVEISFEQGNVLFFLIKE